MRLARNAWRVALAAWVAGAGCLAFDLWWEHSAVCGIDNIDPPYYSPHWSALPLGTRCMSSAGSYGPGVLTSALAAALVAGCVGLAVTRHAVTTRRPPLAPA